MDDQKDETVMLKRRSKHGTLAYVLDAVARQATAAADVARNVTPEDVRQVNRVLDRRIWEIKRQVELVEHFFTKAEEEAA